MQLFALNATRRLGEAVASVLGTSLAAHEEREFEDGEHKSRPLVCVQGRDVYVIHSLLGDDAQRVDERLCRLLFFLATLRDHGARRLTAVVPYLAYGRKDRRTKPGDPVTTRYVAQLLEAVGIDAIVAIEAHNVVAYQNAFRCRTVHLDPRESFATHLLPLDNKCPVVVASPDPGGVKRAQLFREHLELVSGRSIGTALIDKRRSEGVISGEMFAGDVAGASVLLVDDMISTGGTLLRAAASCRTAGAAQITALAAHGLFRPGAQALLTPGGVDRLIVTDSVDATASLDDALRRRVEVVTVAPLIAKAISQLHDPASTQLV